MPKLKKHLLPRIKEMLHQEISAKDADPNSLHVDLSTVQRFNSMDSDSIFIKGDCMYCHNLGRFNYMTYDVRRSQDVINLGTSHHNIMVLANDDNSHPFLYACVLGIYHVNVIYTGGGSVDYTACRVEFLWVRWFEYNSNKSVMWVDLKLNPIHFPPMVDEGTFNFVDPRNVLHGCHIIPAFARGKAQINGIGLLKLAGDAGDWSEYHANRYNLFHCFISWC